MRIFIALVLLLTFYTPSAHSEISLNFGLYASDKPSVVVKQFRPILNHLEVVLQDKFQEPVHIKIQVASSYEKGIENLASGKVDFSRFGPASYVEVKKRNKNVRIIAIESQDGKKTFKGVICVHADSRLLTIDDLRGKRFAFGDKLSTIGRYLSQQYLLKQDIKSTDLSGYDYLGRHDKVGYAVSLGQFDAGALKESTFEKLKKQGVPIKRLAEFENVTKPWIARSALDEKLYVALRESLLALKNSALIRPLKMNGFVAGSDGDYVIIRNAIQENDNFFKSL